MKNESILISEGTLQMRSYTIPAITSPVGRARPAPHHCNRFYYSLEAVGVGGGCNGGPDVEKGIIFFFLCNCRTSAVSSSGYTVP